MRQVLLHDGPVLWPEHKPLSQVEELKATTPEGIWEGTYQGNPTPPGGSTFKREWWRGKNRYNPDDRGLVNWIIGRWISWDTGLRDNNNSAYTVATVGELWPDYRLAIRYVWRDRIEFPDLPMVIEDIARRFNRDEKLRGVLIEDKASGITALQTLSATAPDWLKPLLIAFNPAVDKVVRANQAAVWCKNDCILLPRPGATVPWLLDFETEIFDFPNSGYADQTDSLSQLIIWLENLISDGWYARNNTEQMQG